MTDPRVLSGNRAEYEAGLTEVPLDVDPASGLFGIMTYPNRRLKDTGFILVNPGLLHRVGPFRLYVDIARSVAVAGYPSIRLDLSGKGDSDALTGVSLAEATIANLSAASRRLKNETGVKSFVIGGLCSGADDALQVASHLDGIAGLLMFDGYAPKPALYYFRRYISRLFSVESWLNRLRSFPEWDNKSGREISNLRNWGTPSEMMERYRGMVEGGTHVLAIYSGWGRNFYAYQSQLTNAINHPKASALVSEVHVPQATHLFPVSAHRQLAVNAILEWAERSFVSTIEE